MNWKTANWIGAALMMVMVAVSAAPACAADANLQVKTNQGKVEGRMEKFKAVGRNQAPKLTN